MKERLREFLRGTSSGPPARNLVREFLQASVLGALQRAGAMVPLAFQGGTAFRFLYSIRRHSEDLEFALERSGAGYDFRGYLEATRADLILLNNALRQGRHRRLSGDHGDDREGLAASGEVGRGSGSSASGRKIWPHHAPTEPPKGGRENPWPSCPAS